MTVSGTKTSNSYVAYREDWLDLRREAAIEPDLPIVDAHHHLWDRPRPRYMFEEFLADLGGGHAITATVHVDCRTMYKAAGPVNLRPVGEVEFANGMAAMSASGAYGATRICAGIVGFADLRLGAGARPVLEALIQAGGGRFRGVRHITAWDADPAVHAPQPDRPQGLIDDPGFRAGFACLAPLGLSYDGWLYHPQIPDLARLARDFPETAIVLDHIGTPVGIGRYAGRRDAVFAEWRAGIRTLSACPNVAMKLGGMGMRIFGFDFHDRAEPASSSELATAWAPYIEAVIEAFGAERCMFESNFPPDKGTCSYTVLWNTFKRIAAGCSASEKAALFAGTATRFYRLAPGEGA